MPLRPTPEQQHAVSLAADGGDVAVHAFAGTGKTSTLRLMAETLVRPSLYIAFNAATAQVARTQFPDHVDCRTIHSLAFRSLNVRYDADKLRRRLAAPALAEQLGGRVGEVRRGTRRIRLDSRQRAALILGTVQAFCRSDDPVLDPLHVPLAGRRFEFLGEDRSEFAETVVQPAMKLWERMCDPRDKLPLGHDGYLKLWALGRPQIDRPVLYLDEAQDTNEVVLGILNGQTAMTVLVGDAHQQIYAWRGAVDAMARMKGRITHLTRSFRFGPAIAQAANRVLRTLGETRQIIGHPGIESRILARGPTRAVLARTNAIVIEVLMRALSENQRVHLIGGKGEFVALLRDVRTLKAGQTTVDGDLAGFSNWSAVETWSRTDDGRSLRTLVTLVQEYGVPQLMAGVEASEVSEAAADLVVSTVHKAKGREWPSVHIKSDFRRNHDGTIDPSEVRLFYVALTRARQTIVVDPALMAEFCAR